MSDTTRITNSLPDSSITMGKRLRGDHSYASRARNDSLSKVLKTAKKKGRDNISVMRPQQNKIPIFLQSKLLLCCASGLF